MAIETCAGGFRPSHASTREIDDTHVVIRASFEFRDFLLQAFPETVTVPKGFAKHMMVAADLEHGNPGAIEDAVIGAWELQSGE
jgi:hypothetical protein